MMLLNSSIRQMRIYILIILHPLIIIILHTKSKIPLMIKYNQRIRANNEQITPNIEFFPLQKQRPINIFLNNAFQTQFRKIFRIKLLPLLNKFAIFLQNLQFFLQFVHISHHFYSSSAVQIPC